MLSETLERAAAHCERERERAKVPRADESRPGLRRSVPAAVVQSSSTGNSQKAEPPRKKLKVKLTAVEGCNRLLRTETISSKKPATKKQQKTKKQ